MNKSGRFWFIAVAASRERRRRRRRVVVCCVLTVFFSNIKSKIIWSIWSYRFNLCSSVFRIFVFVVVGGVVLLAFITFRRDFWENIEINFLFVLFALMCCSVELSRSKTASRQCVACHLRVAARMLTSSFVGRNERQEGRVGQKARLAQRAQAEKVRAHSNLTGSFLYHPAQIYSWRFFTYYLIWINSGFFWFYVHKGARDNSSRHRAFK